MSIEEETGLQGRVVVFLRTSSVARAPVYRRLHQLGLILILIHPTTPHSAFQNIFHYHLQHETNDIDSLQPALIKFLSIHQLTPDAIVSFDEYAVYQAAVLAQSFNLRPVPLPAEKLRGTSVKSLFREFCKSKGIASPAATRLTRIQQNSSNTEQEEKNNDKLLIHIQHIMKEAGITFPVVMKPCPGAGSLLAKLCYNVEEVREQAIVMWNVFVTHPDMKHFEALLNPSDKKKKEMQILIEEYIGGQEVDLDCCIENGKIVFCAISDNFEVRPPFFVEEGGLCPTALPHYEQNELQKLLEQFVSFHGKDLHGVLHFEAKYDFNRRRAYVIEVNCRPGSAETNTMIQTCYRGVQLGEFLIRCALGVSVIEQLLRYYPEFDNKITRGITGFEFPPTCYCASVNIYPKTEGVFIRAEVPVADTNIVDFSISATPGIFVAPPPKVFYLLSWIVAKGATAGEAKAAIKRIAEKFVQEISVVQ